VLCRYARFGFGAAAAAGWDAWWAGDVVQPRQAWRVARAKTLRVWTIKKFVKQISGAESVELQQGIDVEPTR
jgi:hypothetical protein